MKVFVTGAGGFIGSHLCEALRDAGHEVAGLELYNSFDSFGWLDEIEGVERIRGDIRDPFALMEMVSGSDVVFHLAALISVPHSFDSPAPFIDTNVTGTLNVLKAALAASAKVVFASTSEVYGTAQYEPIDETHPLVAQSPYAASKIAAEKLVESFHVAYGLPATILRSFNTYGPRQSERAVTASIIRQALDPGCEEIARGTTAARRDLMYVNDTVRAFMAALKVNSFGPFNAGTGVAYKTGEIAGRVKDIVACEKPIKIDLARARQSYEVEALCADPGKFNRAAGWTATVPISRGLLKTIEWRAAQPFKNFGYIA